mgnify:CR=1 FL=1
MKKSELKQILKPLVKECIKEVIFEEGILSNVVSEVVKGLGTNTIVEQRAPQPSRGQTQQQGEQRFRNQLAESRKQLLDAIGKDSYNGVNVFENTEPLRGGGSPGVPTPAGSSPLANVDPSDAGVPIDGILNLSGGKWKALMGK